MVHCLYVLCALWSVCRVLDVTRASEQPETGSRVIMSASETDSDKVQEFRDSVGRRDDMALRQVQHQSHFVQRSKFWWSIPAQGARKLGSFASFAISTHCPFVTDVMLQPYENWPCMEESALQ